MTPRLSLRCPSPWWVGDVTQESPITLGGDGEELTIDARGVGVFVDDLSGLVTDNDLKVAFSAYGQVTAAVVVPDKATGRPKGIGFVEMTDHGAALAAIDGLNSKDLRGRPLRVALDN